MGEIKRRWRDYRTGAGQRPVKKFLMSLPDEQRAAVAEAMATVREKGERAGGARKLHNRIWEVRVDQGEVIHRIIRATEGLGRARAVDVALNQPGGKAGISQGNIGED